jgi:hypothetical protein
MSPPPLQFLPWIGGDSAFRLMDIRPPPTVTFSGSCALPALTSVR